MLSTPHLLVGAAIAKAVPNPLISLPAAFASHFILDTIPHWDGAPKAPFGKFFYLLAGLDYLFGISLIWWFTRDNPQQIILLFAAFSATAPDFLMGTYKNFNLPWNKWGWYVRFNEFHRGIQNNLKIAPGLATSLVTSAVAIFIILKFTSF
ncbi:MAG: hypothetical protein A3F35_03305 [Candidatus Woykebacteria bacterium RIFCSPHIGHO2_12_FULL_45_10]|uniref:Uncharacterized protein n=1 Tax=Candidatus Woykebacteria bacterium RIFCSPHIGHO2_12_FULL_45_10 TaxID=1802603 RepID=A0A1G1WQX5_9BACT|nr:MAG: hypothetical protein A3F35_03305 [Candidatus Woykebacteria bacterium RIFCSPHIGHO2_12_FULL_45_10]